MRNRIDFWLDNTHADDKRVLKRIQLLKSKKSFRKTVMDGIMCMSALAKGDMTLLLKLHPWIVDKILTTYAPPPKPDNDELIEQFKRMLVEQGGIAPAPANYPAMKQSGTMAAKTVAMPVFDDENDQDIIIIREVEIDVMGNFFASFTQVQNHVSDTAGSARTRVD